MLYKFKAVDGAERVHDITDNSLYAAITDAYCKSFPNPWIRAVPVGESEIMYNLDNIISIEQIG